MERSDSLNVGPGQESEWEELEPEDGCEDLVPTDEVDAGIYDLEEEL